jgi:hypothetical protein
VSALARSSRLRCPYCHGRLGAPEAVCCRRCGTPVHADCAAEHGRCVVLGCRGRSFRRGPPGRRRPPDRSWLLRVASPLDDLTLALVGVAGLAAVLLLA